MNQPFVKSLMAKLGETLFDNLPHDEVTLMDSSAATTFMVCPRKYFYQYVLNYRSTIKPPYFAFGSAYHLFRQIIEQEWLNNPDKEQINKYVMKGIECASEYCKKHLETPSEKDNKWGWMNADRLLKSCIEGANFWKAEKLRGAIKVLAIEQPFQIMLPDGVTIAGRADQIVNFNGKVWGRDFKTSSQFGNYYVNSLSPNDQFTRYTYAENKLAGWNENDINDRIKVEGQLIEVLYNTKTTGPKIEVYPAQRTRSELLTWLREQEYWHKLMDMCRKEDIWMMNPKSCTFCEFRRVCELANESMQMSYLKNNYRHEKWDCMRVSE